MTIIEILKRMANDMFLMTRRRLMDGLRSKKVTLLASATCEEIKEGSVLVTTGEGKKEIVPADTVIIAVGYKANDRLYKALEGKVPEIYCIGNSAKPRRILEAIMRDTRPAWLCRSPKNSWLPRRSDSQSKVRSMSGDGIAHTWFV